MKSDYSYGIIPLRRRGQQWEVLVIQHQAGHWAFPKGHSERQESPRQAAERELMEETGLTVESFLTTDPLIENYIFTHKNVKISKTVKYFPALVLGDVVLQESEIRASLWMELPDALNRLTFSEGRRLCLELSEFLTRLSKKLEKMNAVALHFSKNFIDFF